MGSLLWTQVGRHHGLLRRPVTSSTKGPRNLKEIIGDVRASSYALQLSSSLLLLNQKRKEQVAVTSGTLSVSYFNNQRLFSTTRIPMAQQSTPNGSICRQNYHEECEASINKQINMELYASYVYMSIVSLSF